MTKQRGLLSRKFPKTKVAAPTISSVRAYLSKFEAAVNNYDAVRAEEQHAYSHQVRMRLAALQ